MFYVDTAVLVSALTVETASKRAQRWLADRPAGGFCISEWTIAEFSSALSIKLRTRQITAAERLAALAAFARLFRDRVEILQVVSPNFRKAAILADASIDGLRSGDALHLAICMDHGLALCTLDERLVRSASSAGAEVVMP
jgi:uncharacterized protein